MEVLNQQQPIPLQRRDPSTTSVASNSETPNASSDVSSPQPFPLLQDSSLDLVPALPLLRNSRKLVIDSSVALPPNPATIRRKPLSSTASPIATRYSSGAYLTASHELPRPEQRYSRSFSVDSPTVYEFPQLAIAKSTIPAWEPTAKAAAPVEETATQISER